eukprot:6630115-Ditylum_brightwellii.AAC.1
MLCRTLSAVITRAALLREPSHVRKSWEIIVDFDISALTATHGCRNQSQTKEEEPSDNQQRGGAV